MSWFKKSLSCFRHDRPIRCDCHETVVGSKPRLRMCNEPMKSEVSDKNIQCDFDEEFRGNHFGRRECGTSVPYQLPILFK